MCTTGCTESCQRATSGAKDGLSARCRHFMCLCVCAFVWLEFRIKGELKGSHPTSPRVFVFSSAGHGKEVCEPLVSLYLAFGFCADGSPQTEATDPSNAENRS